MDKILCPHCKEPLVIRCYYERWVDFASEVAQPSEWSLNKKPYLMYDDSSSLDNSEHYTGGEIDEFNDYECSICKESVKEYIGMPIEDLPASMKGGEAK